MGSRKLNFQSLADAFGEEIADLGVTRDGLDEAVGGIEPDGMTPSFALQHAALFLQMADEVAAFHSAKEHSGRFFLQGKAIEDRGKTIAPN